MDRQIALLLAMLAEQTGAQVSKDRYAFYIEYLMPLGEAVIPALKQLLLSARHFPTVQEIRDAMGMRELTPQQEGREVAARLWSAVCKFSSQVNDKKMPEIETYVGPVGWAVVQQLGGWNSFVDGASAADQGIVMAQWREHAAVVKIRVEHNRALALGMRNQENPMLSLVSGMANILDVGRKRNG